MQLLVSSIAVLSWLGCTQADTPEPLPAPVTPSPSPAPSPSPSEAKKAPRAKSPTDAPAGSAQYADRYLVIVATERDAAALDAIDARLRKQAPDGFAPFRLSSTDWSGLRPCYALLVADAFPSKEAAVARSAALEKAGIESYVRNTHDHVGDHPARRELCTTPAPVAPSVSASAVWLVGSEGLELGPNDAPVKLETTDRRTWTAPLPAPSIGGVARGDRFRLMSADGKSRVCAVSGFEAVVTGVPHFGYFQQEPPPTTPGCGSQEAVARFDGCTGWEDATFAIPESASLARVYRALPNAPVRDREALEAVLRAASEVVQARAGLAEIAAREKSPVEEQLTRTVFEGPYGQVVHLQLDLRVAIREENVECGIDAEEVRISGAWLVGGERRIEVLAIADRTDEDLIGLVDLGADGNIEAILTDRTYSGETRIERQGEVLARRAVAFCDCPC